MFLETGSFGARLTKYVVYGVGFALLQLGPIGGGLGGYLASSGRRRRRYFTGGDVRDQGAQLPGLAFCL